MPIEITDLTDRVGRIQVNLPGVATEITIPEAVEVLETLARILGYSLVDREERQSLVELADDIRRDPDMYDVAQGWAAWRGHARALSSAVLSAIATDDEAL